MDANFKNWFLEQPSGPSFEQGTSSRRRRRLSPEPPERPKLDRNGTEYAAVYQEKEIQACLQVAAAAQKSVREKIQGPGMDQFEEDLDSGKINEEFENLSIKTSVYKEFSFAPPNREPLAIDSYKEEILSRLIKRSTLVVKGFTGCGKTTQVPQFILDSCAAAEIPCNIVVTQPRRIAAISVAKRVSAERNWELGTVVGYHVGMECRAKDFTCVTYMTTGCLLEMLVGKKSLKGYTHIIIDEIHERDEDTDILLLVVRKLLWKNQSSVKVILMSATVDATKFAEYFSSPLPGGIFDPAPVVNVDCNPPFSVTEYFLDELRDMTILKGYVPDDPKEPAVEDKAYDCAARIIACLDDYLEIRRYGRADECKHLSKSRGAVLLFLPGLAEIEAMHKHLLSYEPNRNEHGEVLSFNWLILPLHSRVTSEEQSRVFQIPPSTSRKIILATNIAESSITVPDIVYVIDFCLVRQLVVDDQTNFSALKVCWSSRSSCVQRKGRVGRVDHGIVYRMVSRNHYYRIMDEDVKAEILRCPLEQTILRVKLLEMGEPKALLALALEPPNQINIDKTILTLKEVGALFLTSDGSLAIKPDDGDLSFLGRVIARLPIDVHLGKLVMLGHIFNVLKETVIIAAGLGGKNIFTSPYDKTRKLEAYYLKMSWAEGSFSDPITILNAYQVWKSKFNSTDGAQSKTGDRGEREWAKYQNIQLKALKDMDYLVREIEYRLKTLGIEAPTGPNVSQLTPMQKSLLLRVVLFGAFYPQFFGRSAGQINERDAVKELCGCDPFSTIKLSQWKMEQPGKAYLGQLKHSVQCIFDVLKDDTWRFNIKFDSTRVMVQFYQEGNSSIVRRIPGRVAIPVYLALKQKRLQNRQARERGSYYVIDYLHPQEAQIHAQRVEQMARELLATIGNLQRDSCTSMLQLPPPRLPEVEEEEIAITISHVEEPNHFWAQRIDQTASQDYKHMIGIIGENGRNLVKGQRFPINIGSLVMAPYQDPDSSLEYYRAKIISCEWDSDKVRVYYIDYGNTGEVWKVDLCQIPEPLLGFPPLAMECYLTGVGPSLTKDPKGKWAPQAHEWLNQLVFTQLKARIYSVVNGVVSLDAYPADRDFNEYSLCKELIKFNYAVPVEETFCSRQDNEERRAALKVPSDRRLPTYQTREYESLRRFTAEMMATDQLEFPRKKIEYTLALNGPSNPLEIKMFGKVKSLIGCNMTVDDDSVNSVLLDSNPESKHERFLIAAQVSSCLDGGRVKVRQTTLLPAIPGMSSILSLIFTPRAEFRANLNRTSLTGALCGLGKNEDSTPVYSDHDMEIAFDTEITTKDVLEINKIRFWMNSVLGPRSFGNIPEAPSVERMREVSYKCIRSLFQLLTPHRTDMEPVDSPYRYKWDKVEAGHLIRSESPEDHILNLLPLHDYINIIPKVTPNP